MEAVGIGGVDAASTTASPTKSHSRAGLSMKFLVLLLLQRRRGIEVDSASLDGNPVRRGDGVPLPNGDDTTIRNKTIRSKQMKPSTEHEIKGTFHEVKGSVKETGVLAC